MNLKKKKKLISDTHTIGTSDILSIGTDKNLKNYPNFRIGMFRFYIYRKTCSDSKAIGTNVLIHKTLEDTSDLRPLHLVSEVSS